MNKLQKTLFVVLMLSLILLGGCAGDNSKLPAGGTPETQTAGDSPDQDGASSESAPQDQEETAPIFITFEGTDLDGNTVSQEIFSQSKLTMVNVWATYCNPCLSEMPGLGELAAEYDPAELQLIGIVSDVMEGEDQSLVERLIQETGADYPHLLANDSIGQAILSSVSGVPTTFFFDGEGAYLGGVAGPAEKEKWKEIIHGLLEEM